MIGADAYINAMKSPFDGLLEAYGQGQTLRRNRNILQAEQAEQERKLRAQNLLEMLDWNDQNAIAQLVAQFPEYTKGAQDYYNNINAKEQEALLLDMSKSISALGSDRPDIAVQMMRDQANAYADMGDDAKAQERSQMAEWMTRDPQAAHKALLMSYSRLAGKDAGSNYKDYSSADIAEEMAPYEREQASVTATKGRAETDAIIAENISNAAVTSDPTYFMQRIGMMVDQGLVSPEIEAQLRTDMSNEQTAEVASLLRSIARGNPEIAKALIPQLQYTNTGGFVQLTEYDPLSGTVVDKGSLQVTQSPDNAATIAQSERESIRSAEVSKYTADQRALLDKYQIDVDAANADKKLEWAMQKEEIESKKGKLQTIGDKTYVVYNDGTAREAVDVNGNPIKPTPKGKKPRTESQTKDYLFGSRMQEANKIIANLEKNGVTRGSYISRMGDIGENIANKLPSFLFGNSPEQQQYIQAQRDFINAILRRESGAAIAESEFANAQKQYFPQVGDSEAVISQKKKNRELAANTLLESANGEQAITVGGGRGNSAVNLSDLIY